MADYLLAWGAKVPRDFALRVIQTGDDFPGLVPSNLMACMAFETGETFSPSVHNPASSATGEIQFMEKTAEHYGTTTAALAKMTQVKQFDFVWLYFRDAIKAHGPLRTLGDTYMAILNPSAIGKPDDFVMWVSGSSAFAANAGLDANKDHQITKAEAVAHVQAKLDKGLLEGNLGRISLAGGIPAPVQPKGSTIMNLVSGVLNFVWDHTFASAARAAATADPNAAATGIDVIKSLPVPTEGSANSPAGIASGPIANLENAINDLVANFVKEGIDQLPGVGGIAEVTGLDQKGADAAKALLVLAEQHALTFMSSAFSHGHAAINKVTVPSSNGAGVAQSAPPSSEEAPH